MTFPRRPCTLLLLAAAAACGDSARGRPKEELVSFSDIPPATSAPAAEPAAPAEASARGGDSGASAPASVDVAAVSDQAIATDSSSASTESTAPMLVRTGTATVQVDSLAAGVGRVSAVARSVGGYVAGSSMQSSRDEVRQATLELKVPAARWDQALAALGRLGKVEQVSVQAEDVGEEFVDVRAREANARRLEDRLVRLLETRTGKLEEVLKVERELARVREEIERYDGRLRYLSARAVMSTLTVRLHEPLPVSGERPGASLLGQAVHDALRNSVTFVTWLIAALGWIVPGALILYVVWLVVRRAARRLWQARPETAGPTKLVIRRPKRPNLKVE